MAKGPHTFAYYQTGPYMMAKVSYTTSFTISAVGSSTITTTTADDLDAPEVELWVLHDSEWKMRVLNERVILKRDAHFQS